MVYNCGMATTTVVPDGDKVRQLRTARGWSQADLAGMAGVTQPRISTIEAGVVTRQSVVKHLALIFGLGPLRWPELIAAPDRAPAPAAARLIA